MIPVTSLLQLSSAACIGVFTSAAAAELFLLVPWWRSLAAAEFFSWYAANDERLLGFFRPLTIATAAVAFASALASWWTGDAGRWAAAAACGLVLSAVSMFFLYFEGANASFSAASLDAAGLSNELARWQSWHAARTAISLGALVFSLIAIARA